jgi:hypothetical protein
MGALKRGLGIGIDHDTVRAVFVRDGAIVWMAEGTWGSETPLAAAIGDLLTDAPRCRGRSTDVNVAVGVYAAQVKLLTGLPIAADRSSLAAVIREGAESFFLRSGDTLVTTDVYKMEDDRVCAAAIDLATIDAIRDACRRPTVKLRLIVPTAAVLPLVSRNDQWTWIDGDVALQSTRSGSALETVRCIPTLLVSPDEPLFEPIERLSELGPEGSRFADAYGATLVKTSAPLALGPDGRRPAVASTSHRRIVLPAAIAGLGLIVSLLSPLGELRVAHMARGRVERSRSTPAWSSMVSSNARLDRVTAVLGEVEAFTTSRPERAVLLGDLTRALPEESAIVRMEIDESEGRLVVVTPESQSFVGSLRSLASLSSVDVAGEVTREQVGGRVLERVSVHFRIKDVQGTASENSKVNGNH